MDTNIFKETQRITSLWLIIPLILLAIFFWYAFFKQIIFGQPVGSKPGANWLLILLWSFAGILLPIYIFTVSLTIELGTSALRIRAPLLLFGETIISYSELQEAKAVTIHPVREAGGWGNRQHREYSQYLTLLNKQGVVFELATGEKIYIGTASPDKIKNILSKNI